MKLLKYSLLALAPIGSLSAAITTFDATEYAVNSPLTTVPGWTATETAPANQPLSWITPWSSNGGVGNKAGAIGGYYNSPVADSYSVSSAVSQAISGTSISFDMAIQDSTNGNVDDGYYTNRDVFGFSVSTSTGDVLASLTFTPTAQTTTPEGGTAASWLVSYTVAGGTTQMTSIPMYEDVQYLVELSFSGSEVTIGFGAGEATNVFTATMTGVDSSAEIGSVSFDWEKSVDDLGVALDFGDNFVRFDNLAVTIPEPSSALLMGVASLGLLRRRRTN
jgi:hypothetical protein